MKAAWVVAALLTGIVAAPWSARATMPLEDENYDRPRFYLGFGPALGIENFNLKKQSASFGGPTISNIDPDVDGSYGAEGRAGYRFHPYLAGELQGQFNGEFDVHGDVGGAVGKPLLGSVRIVTTTANLKAFALTGPIQPYALGGVGFMWANTQHKASGAALPENNIEFAGRGGVGVDAYIVPMLAVYAEASYLAPVGTLDRFGLAAITAGMQWHF